MTVEKDLLAAAVSGMQEAHTGIEWCDADSVDGSTEHFARAATIAVLEFLAENASWYGGGDVATWRHDELADLINALEAAVRD